MTYGLHLTRSSILDATIFSYANCGGYVDVRRNMKAYYVFIGDNLILWSFTKQKVVACSATELEDHTLASVANEIEWTKSLMVELGIKQK